MSLLAIDQGNRRTKCGMFDGDDLLAHWVAPTEKAISGAELADMISLGLAHRFRGDFDLGLCSVVPELLPAWREAAALLGMQLTVLTGTSPTPLRNAYHTPETLGPDRLMVAVAAAALVGTPVVSISMGTATVVDAISADGAYLGGMIAPGIGVDIDALAQAASALPPARWEPPASAIGRSTAEALTAGLFHHSLGGLRAMIAAIRADLAADAPLALTGGWAETVAPYLDGVALVDPHLVLRGITRTLSR